MRLKQNKNQHNNHNDGQDFIEQRAAQRDGEMSADNRTGDSRQPEQQPEPPIEEALAAEVLDRHQILHKQSNPVCAVRRGRGKSGEYEHRQRKQRSAAGQHIDEAGGCADCQYDHDM